MNSSASRSPTTSTRFEAKASISDSSRARRSAASIGGSGNCSVRRDTGLPAAGQNPAGGASQVIDHGVRAESRQPPVLLTGSITGSHENTARADGSRERYVDPAIAHGERALRIDPQ